MEYAVKAGQTLKGRYQLIRLLRQSSMSSVFMAKDVIDGGFVIVKRTKPLEALLLSKCEHPGIVSYIGSFTDTSGFYLVEEYVRGEELEGLIRRRGPLGIKAVISVGLQLCSVLDYLHGQSPPIIYRDLKPENILIVANDNESGDEADQIRNREYTVKLVDFGIAREYVLREDKDTTSYGTKGYAAPEQYEGSFAQSDSRSDIYAMGKVLYYLVTGDDPKQYAKEEQRAEFRRLVRERVKYSSLKEIILKCTEENPEKRFQSAGALAYAIQMAESDARKVKAQETGRKEKAKEIKTRAGVHVDDQKERKKEPKDKAAVLLVLLAVLFYTCGFVLGFAKGYPNDSSGFAGFHWVHACMIWIAAYAAGTLVLGFASVLRHLSAIRHSCEAKKKEPS